MPPFYDKSEPRLLRAIMAGKFSFKDPVWEPVSPAFALRMVAWGSRQPEGGGPAGKLSFRHRVGVLARQRLCLAR